MLELPDLLAREGIRDIVARYNAYGDSGLLDRMLALFADDAVLEIDGVADVGLAAIRARFAATVERTRDAPGGHAGPAYIRHCTTTHQIDLLGDGRASGRLYFFVLTPIGLDHWGRYLDDYVLVDGAWRFARRRVLVDDSAPGSHYRRHA